MLIRHEPESYCSPKASQSLHWITQLAGSSALEAYFVRLGGNASQAWDVEMELRHLRYFVALADAGRRTAAAPRMLHTSQPSLSRQSQELEDEVVTRRRSRRARGVDPAPTGQ